MAEEKEIRGAKRRRKHRSSKSSSTVIEEKERVKSALENQEDDVVNDKESGETETGEAKDSKKGNEETEKDLEDDKTDKPKRKRKRKRKSKAASSDAPKETNPEEAAKKIASLDHTVYVEGIPFDCTEDEVKDFFVSHGVEDILQLRLPRWQDSGRLRGYGHAVFGSEDSRTKALNDLNGKNLRTRYITIKEAKNPKPDTTMGAASVREARSQPMGCTTIFCKNLPYDASEEDLHEVFSVCGKIVEGGIRVARNYQTKQSKGFAYVEYKNPEGAESAVQKASKPFGLCVMGRPCFVDYEEQKMKGSFKTKDGRLWSREFNRNVHSER